MLVHGRDGIAGLGNQLFNKLELVNQDYTWCNGFSWMKKEKRYFPAKSTDEIRLRKEQYRKKIF